MHEINNDIKIDQLTTNHPLDNVQIIRTNFINNSNTYIFAYCSRQLKKQISLQYT